MHICRTIDWPGFSGHTFRAPFSSTVKVFSRYPSFEFGTSKSWTEQSLYESLTVRPEHVSKPFQYFPVGKESETISSRPCTILYSLYLVALISGSLRSVYGAANADVHTLFTQYTNPDSASRYFRAGFKPQFLSSYTEEQNVACTPQGASAPLQGCLYDYAMSGNRAFAVQNIDITKSFEEEQSVLGEQIILFIQNVSDAKGYNIVIIGII